MGVIMEKKRVRKRKRKLKKWVKVTLLIIFLIIIGLIVKNIFVNKKDNGLDNLANNEMLEKLRYKYGNSEIIARMVIEGIDLDVPVTQTNNNDYYLKYDAYKEISEYGNPFFDYRNLKDLKNEKQINIYSHNVYSIFGNKKSFAKLEDYMDKKIFLIAKDIIIYTDSDTLKYEVFAVKLLSSSDNEHMILHLNNNEEWQDHYDKLLNRTLYCVNNCHLNNDDDILVIQTCNHRPDNSYIVIVAKKIPTFPRLYNY